MAGSPDAFNDLGVSVTNADGSMRDAESVFNDTLKALSQIDNETERDQKAYEIFGKSADQLAGIIDDGGAALQQLWIFIVGPFIGGALAAFTWKFVGSDNE
jgi:hypothetical protein